VYPSENTALMSQIEERGAVFSEAPCGLRIRPERFLARNRLIAALSDGVVVVEAAYRSGAINTAHHAAGLGRQIGVVPGRWGDPAARGCFRIARDVGAMVLTEAADVGFLLPGMPGVHA
ncbi:MAG: DNA-processing protein DprA, partial [Pontimonas sp.]